MNSKVLLVDDETEMLRALDLVLRKHFTVTTAVSGASALAILEKNGPVAIVLADMQMPGMDGVELLAKIEEKWPETVRMMLTGDTDRQTALAAVNRGHVYGLLTKPCPPETLVPTLSNAAKHYDLVVAQRELLEKTLNGSIQVLMDVLAVVDSRAFGRGQRLREHMHAVLMAYQGKSSWECELAATLASIGNVTVPPGLLLRSRQKEVLRFEEREILTRIPEAGSNLLSKIPRLEGVARAILYQNKCFDGSGFPKDKISGVEIPLGARVLKILLALLDYESQAKLPSEAMQLMQNTTGVYDPEILAAAGRSLHILEETAGGEGRRALKLGELRPGHVLRNALTTPEGLLLVPAGQKITPTVLELLRNFAKLGQISEPIEVEG